MGYGPYGNVNLWKVGAIALAAAAVIAGTILTVVTFGAGSVAGSIMIAVYAPYLLPELITGIARLVYNT